MGEQAQNAEKYYHNGDVQVPQELLPFIPGYLQRRDSDILELRTYIQSQNFTAIGALAHKLKGVGSSYGFHAVTEIATELNLVAKNKDELRARKLIENLFEVVEDLKKKAF